MPKTYRVDHRELERGARIEAGEHPGASDRTHHRLAREHLAKYGPGYYRAEPMSEKIIQNINKKMGAKPIRKKVRRQYDPLTDGVPQMPKMPRGYF